MAAIKSNERCLLLSEIGNGILARLHWARNSMLAKDSLNSPMLSKVKAKVEKQFPEFKDLQKVTGYNILVENTPLFASDLKEIGDLILDVVDFNDASAQILLDLSSNVAEFSLERSRHLCLVFLDLMLVVMRVNILCELMPERRTLYGLYSVVYQIANGSSDPALTRTAKYFDQLADRHRFCIDFFNPHISLVGSVILQLRDSINVSLDLDSLRNKYILNPLQDGDAMALPSRKNLTAVKSSMSVYPELTDCSKYVDYVVYGMLACPALLFSAEHFDIFRIVVQDLLCVRIFREVSLDVHTEFDDLSTNFPAKKDNVNVPKGFKLKTALKDIARECMKSSGLRKIERRAFLRGELLVLKNLFLSVPGLTGPKLPQAIAACSMAKAEVLSYFRHIEQETRRDVAKHLIRDHFSTGTNDLPPLLKELTEITAVLRANAHIIARYYAEYLRTTHLSSLGQLLEEIGGPTASLPSSSAGIAEPLGNNVKSLCDELAEVGYHSSVPTPEAGSLGMIRMACERISVSLLQRNSGEPAFSSLESRTAAISLLRRISLISEHSLYADSLEQIVLPDYCLPYEMWFFQRPVLAAFTKSLHESPFDSHAALSFLQLPQIAMLNINDDCPEERTVIGEASKVVCDGMLLEIGGQIQAILQPLETFILGLISQTDQSETAYRQERSLLAKKMNKVYSEPIPGSESEPWARASIQKLILIRTQLTNVLTSAQRYPKFVVFDREYYIVEFIRQLIDTYVENRIQEVFDTDKLKSFGQVAKSFRAVCQVAQVSLSALNAYFPYSLRQILFKAFCVTQIPPTGGGMPVLQDDFASFPLITSIGKWFVAAAEHLSTPKSGVMWVKSMHSFCRRNAHPQSKDELVYMVSIIGLQGLRGVNSFLIRELANKLSEMRAFLQSNRGALSELKRDFCTSLSAAGRIQGITGFFQLSISFGTLLSMRERLLGASYSCSNLWAAGLSSTLDAVLSAVDPWKQEDGLTSIPLTSGGGQEDMSDGSVLSPLFELAADSGVRSALDRMDLSLQASLAPIAFPSGGAAEAESDTSLMELLPVAFAACLFSERWDTSDFFPILEAFDGNEHLIAMTAAKIITTVLGSSFAAPRGQPGSVHSGMSSTDLNQSNRHISGPAKRAREAAENFVVVSSHILTTLRSRATEATAKNKPLRAMDGLVEYFVSLCPPEVITRNCLEKSLPYAMIHADSMDIAFGRLRSTDKLEVSYRDDESVAPSVK